MAKKQDENALLGLKAQLDKEMGLSEVNNTENELLNPISKTKKVVAEKQSDWRDKVKKHLGPLVIFDCILPGSKEQIKYSSMSTRDLKKLLIYQNVSDPALLEEILDKLIESLVINEDFNVDNLLVLDKIFLLIQIRVNSKGGTLESTYSCNNCRQLTIFNQSLYDLKVIPMPENINTEIVVDKNFSIYLGYNTRGEQKAFYKHAVSKKAEDRQAELGLLNLASLIKGIKIDGEIISEEMTIEDKITMFMDLPESILDKIIAWESENAFGIDLRYDRICHHCGTVDNIEVPMSSLF